uniref:4a-hydroxytetrahydrobiopterin dehydratase n=1 Tax=Compsopogon caeruleus TaxID=31354 RepID=A0A7S1XCU0_9RHOD|mmetsp:Transcript_17457/g.36244  ORF Transcript_17457/g.36244 Transcript_17457/m.36244 type:complete len:379 (+) Transcript_17457:54-1190(+)
MLGFGNVVCCEVGLGGGKVVCERRKAVKMRVGIPDEVVEEVAEVSCEEYIRGGMVVGLGGGGGRLIRALVRRLDMMMLAERLVDCTLVASSAEVEGWLREAGLPVGALAHHPTVDVAFFSADVVDDDLNFIARGVGSGGLGGDSLTSSSSRLLRDQVLGEAASDKILLVEEDQLVGVLNQEHAIPVEIASEAVTPFQVARRLKQLRSVPEGTCFEEGRICLGGPLFAPELLDRELNEIAGIVAHGLFCGFASRAIIGGEQSVFEKTDAVSSLSYSGTPLSMKELDSLLMSLPQWRRVPDRAAIQRGFKFDNPSRAFLFVENVALLAKRLGHFPEVAYAYDHVQVTMTSHPTGKLSRLDFVMAHLLNRYCDGVRGCSIA